MAIRPEGGQKNRNNQSGVRLKTRIKIYINRHDYLFRTKSVSRTISRSSFSARCVYGGGGVDDDYDAQPPPSTIAVWRHMRRSRKGHDRRRLFRDRARCKVTVAAPAPAVCRRLLPGQRRVNARPAPPRIDTRLRRSGFSPNAHPPITRPNDKVLRARDPKGCASRSRFAEVLHWRNSQCVSGRR